MAEESRVVVNATARPLLRANAVVRAIGEDAITLLAGSRAALQGFYGRSSYLPVFVPSGAILKCVVGLPRSGL